MAQYRLTAGMHVDKNGTYNAGDVVESDVDLVEKFGATKFKLIGGGEGGLKSGTGNPTPGDPTPENVIHNPSLGASGQVQTGFQSTSGSSPSGIQSGGAPEEVVRETLGQENKGQANVPAAQQPAQQFPTLKGQPPPKSEREYHAALERLSVRDLQEHAAEEEIDLKGATRKEEIIKAIKAAK